MSRCDAAIRTLGVDLCIYIVQFNIATYRTRPTAGHLIAPQIPISMYNSKKILNLLYKDIAGRFL